jgi:hypothetical protein
MGERTIVIKTEVSKATILYCCCLTIYLEYHLPNDQVENERLGMALRLFLCMANSHQIFSITSSS